MYLSLGVDNGRDGVEFLFTDKSDMSRGNIQQMFYYSHLQLGYLHMMDQRELHNIRYANNLLVSHSISSFDCALEMACSISRRGTALYWMKIIQRQTAASKAKNIILSIYTQNILLKTNKRTTKDATINICKCIGLPAV